MESSHIFFSPFFIFQATLFRLREQLSAAQVDADKLSVVRIHEASLETQVRQLQDDLVDARKSHTPVSSYVRVIVDTEFSIGSGYLLP